MDNGKKLNACDCTSQAAKNREMAALWEKYCGKQISGCFNLKNSRKRHHSRSFIFGVVLIAIGIFCYAKVAGLLPDRILMNFWPVLIMGIGIWIIVSSAIRQKKYKQDA